jgi:hypothetical protein
VSSTRGGSCSMDSIAEGRRSRKGKAGADRRAWPDSDGIAASASAELTQPAGSNASSHRSWSAASRAASETVETCAPRSWWGSARNRLIPATACGPTTPALPVSCIDGAPSGAPRPRPEPPPWRREAGWGHATAGTAASSRARGTMSQDRSEPLAERPRPHSPGRGDAFGWRARWTGRHHEHRRERARRQEGTPRRGAGAGRRKASDDAGRAAEWRQRDRRRPPVAASTNSPIAPPTRHVRPDALPKSDQLRPRSGAAGIDPDVASALLSAILRRRWTAGGCSRLSSDRAAGELPPGRNSAVLGVSGGRPARSTRDP